MNGTITTGSLTTGGTITTNGGARDQWHRARRSAWVLAHQGGFNANNRLIFYLGGGVRLLVESTGSQNIGSDRKLKKDIEAMDGALQKVTCN